jgi:hypothetical protein
MCLRVGGLDYGSMIRSNLSIAVTAHIKSLPLATCEHADKKLARRWGEYKMDT